MIYAAGFLLGFWLGADPTADTAFWQEYHEAYPLRHGEGANDVRAVAADAAGNVYAATRAGAFVLPNGGKEWAGPLAGGGMGEAGPCYDLCVDSAGTVWMAGWRGLYRAAPPRGALSEDANEHHVPGMELAAAMDTPLLVVCVHREGVAAAGPGEGPGPGRWVHIAPGHQHSGALPAGCPKSVRRMLPDGDDAFWIATGMGLCHYTPDGVKIYQKSDEILSSDVYGLAYAADGTLWVGGLGGVTLYREGRRVGQFTPADGLPSALVQAVARDPEGCMWVGTDKGVARYDGREWSLRHSRRWLLDDDVRHIAFDADGTAWIATAGGVSAIRRRQMTLAEKAGYFHAVTEARHVRDPYIVERCRLAVPGDLATWTPEDDDNDGGYTAMYLAAESFRYAATQDPDALDKARKAFDTLHLLQTVTGTPGFIARSVVPADWTHMHDPNRTYTPQERADALARDPRYKPVEERWRPSADGKWLWKGDTSSDEITAHFFGWAVYYDLAADDADKERIRDLTRRVMDHIINGGFVLLDIDGKHTRWGVWAPERLNHDPDWAPERGINSAEILSYLKTAHHVTGDERYQVMYLHLINTHGYAENARHAKTYEPAWRTHIDAELLAFTYPGLLRYETDPELLAIYRESLDHWYDGVRNEQNAFADMIHAWLTGKDPEPAATLFMLRDTPLDLINWRMDNSRREDLHLRREPILEDMQTSRLLPPSERGVIRWDKNPWAAVQGDGGHSEWAPTFWLLPYWMARYMGLLAG